MGAKDQGADVEAVAKRWQTVPRTLCFVTYGDDLLLMKRAAHKRVFPNHFNGVGGHIERDESPQAGAIREIKEETGLDVAQVRYHGSTHIDAGQATGIMLFIFTAKSTNRNLIPCDEGELHWLPLQDVLQDVASVDPKRLYVEDLPIILPLVFGPEGPPFFAHVSYDADDNIIFHLS